jgi:hypothetical protein
MVITLSLQMCYYYCLWNTNTPQIRLRLGVSRCPIEHQHMIVLNYVFFSNYYHCRCVCVVCGVRVCVCAS